MRDVTVVLLMLVFAVVLLHVPEDVEGKRFGLGMPRVRMPKVKVPRLTLPRITRPGKTRPRPRPRITRPRITRPGGPWKPTGPRGPRKPTGPRGPRKPTGPRGPRKPTRPRGPRKPIGPHGPRKPTGPHGPRKNGKGGPPTKKGKGGPPRKNGNEGPPRKKGPPKKIGNGKTGETEPESGGKKSVLGKVFGGGMKGIEVLSTMAGFVQSIVGIAYLGNQIRCGTVLNQGVGQSNGKKGCPGAKTTGGVAGGGAGGKTQTQYLSKTKCLEAGKDQADTCIEDWVPDACTMTAEATPQNGNQPAKTKEKVQTEIDYLNQICCVTCKKAFDAKTKLEKKARRKKEEATTATCVDKDKWCTGARGYVENGGCTDEDAFEVGTAWVKDNCCQSCEAKAKAKVVATCVDKDKWCTGAQGYVENDACTKGGLYDAPMDTPEKVKAVCCLSCQKKATEEAAKATCVDKDKWCTGARGYVENGGCTDEDAFEVDTAWVKDNCCRSCEAKAKAKGATRNGDVSLNKFVEVIENILAV